MSRVNAAGSPTLNEVVSAERTHIAFFGLRNAGKSSLVNAVTGQSVSVVSDVAGTTTDPVRKAMELLPLGPVLIIDTPGMDDEGELGCLRVQRARQALEHTDVAVLVVDALRGRGNEDEELISIFDEKKIPYVVALNKADELTDRPELKANEIYTSALTGENVNALKDMIASLAPAKNAGTRLVGDLLEPGDLVVLVVPIDKAAPKGRLILPQQQTMRDILDSGCAFAACRDTELADTLTSLAKKPKLVITDSQVFAKVAKLVPEDIALTSFSILFARYRGDLPSLLAGADRLADLGAGDRVLISEGCTHHRQCGDIGTQKIPALIRSFCGSEPEFDFTSGGDFPEDPAGYSLVIHCGACTLSEREMASRMERATAAGVPMVNYGVAIAKMTGVLDRAAAVFGVRK